MQLFILGDADFKYIPPPEAPVALLFRIMHLLMVGEDVSQ
jgi:hypothetical protein